jgi:hypothetical protein
MTVVLPAPVASLSAKRSSSGLASLIEEFVFHHLCSSVINNAGVNLHGRLVIDQTCDWHRSREFVGFLKTSDAYYPQGTVDSCRNKLKQNQ